MSLNSHYYLCVHFVHHLKISETLLLAESDFLHLTSCYNQGLSNLITEGHASVNNSVRHWNCSGTQSANLILGVVKDIREEFQKVTHLIEKDYSGLHQFDLNWIHFTSAFSCVCLDNARMRGVDEGRPHSLPCLPCFFFSEPCMYKTSPRKWGTLEQEHKIPGSTLKRLFYFFQKLQRFNQERHAPGGKRVGIIFLKKKKKRTGSECRPNSPREISVDLEGQ